MADKMGHRKKWSRENKMSNKISDFEKDQVRSEELAEFHVGDTVDVHVRIVESDKQRVQIFNGTVIGRKNAGIRSAFTVRRIVAGEGVERTFPLHSPWIEKIEVKRLGRVRRAKLYYLRDRIGKATKVREKVAARRKS
jgi:large subunit ribosomal protein L19